MYCTNCDLCIKATNDASESMLLQEDLAVMCIITGPPANCGLGTCDSCPREAALMLQLLGTVDEVEEVDVCLWGANVPTWDTLHLNDFIITVHIQHICFPKICTTSASEMPRWLSRNKRDVHMKLDTHTHTSRPKRKKASAKLSTCDD